MLRLMIVENSGSIEEDCLTDIMYRWVRDNDSTFIEIIRGLMGMN